LTVSFTATQIIEQNGYVVDTDFTVANVEYLINDSVDYVNLIAGTTIPHMTGEAEAKTITVSERANAALKPLLACTLRENKKTQLSNASSTTNATGDSNSVSAAGLSASESSSISTAISAANSINNAANTIYRDMFRDAIEALKSEAKDVEYNYRRAIA
jgi:hypothetical protein